jgi:dTDP-4-dehydrorhamnose reductase
MKKCILITGGDGFVAHEIAACLSDGYRIISLGRMECDVTDARLVEDIIRGHRPHAVIHTAAMVDKKKCEMYPETARHINAHGTRNAARASSLAGAMFVLISSDFVFSGAKRSPYIESDETIPVNMYGLSKLSAERHAMSECPDALVIRTSKLFGSHGRNFISVLPGLLKAERILKVADDVISSVTFAEDFAMAVGRLIANRRKGVFHVVNAGECTVSGFARQLADATRSRTRLVSTRHEDIVPGVAAPPYCVLTSQREQEAPEVRLRPWEDAAQVFLSRVFHE